MIACTCNNISVINKCYLEYDEAKDRIRNGVQKRTFENYAYFRFFTCKQNVTRSLKLRKITIFCGNCKVYILNNATKTLIIIFKFKRARGRE